MLRQKAKISIGELEEALIKETTRQLGCDAGGIGEKIEVRHRQGDPNWDAGIGLSLHEVVAAFGRVCSTLRKQYDLE